MSRAKWERDTLSFCAKRSFQFQLTLSVRQHAQNEETTGRNAACDKVAIDRDCDADGRCSQESSGGSRALHPGAATITKDGARTDKRDSHCKRFNGGGPGRHAARRAGKRATASAMSRIPKRTKSIAERQTSIYVRSPASFPAASRSQPIIPPSATAASACPRIQVLQSN